MMHRAQQLRRVFFCAALVCLGPPAAAAQNGEPLPTAAVVMEKVIERARWVQEHRPALQYTYRQQVLVEKMDGDGAVKEREERIYELARVEDEPFFRLVQKNGQPPTKDDLEDEAKREKEFRKRLAERRKKKSDEEGFRFDRDLVSKYRGEMLGREVVNGRPAYVLRFEPKSRDLPVRKRVDRLTNKLAGKLWVDAQDYEVVKAEGNLIEPARVGLGLIANFTKLDFSVEMVRLDDSTYLPLRLDALLQGRVVFSTIHQRQTIHWQNFQKTEAAAQKGAAH
jgi:hypothetical protein